MLAVLLVLAAALFLRDEATIFFDDRGRLPTERQERLEFLLQHAGLKDARFFSRPNVADMLKAYTRDGRESFTSTRIAG